MTIVYSLLMLLLPDKKFHYRYFSGSVQKGMDVVNFKISEISKKL